MLVVIGLMVGAYIVTRMVHLLIDQKPHGIVIIFAVGTILCAMVGMVLLLLSGIGHLNLPGLT